MEATLYSLKTQREISVKGSLLSNLLSPLIWNWISIFPFPYNPEGLKKFLQKYAIDSTGVSYYVRVGSGFMAGIFGAASYGTLSLSKNEFYFSDNNLIWKVPFISVVNITLRGKNGFDRLMRETRIILDFNFAGGLKHYCISVPEVAAGSNLPLEDNISGTQTEMLFNLLKENVAKAGP